MRISAGEYRDWARLAAKDVVLAVILWTIFGICFGLHRMEGVAMGSRIEDGDLVLISRFSSALSSDDAIIFEYKGKDYISRIVGFPGETESDFEDTLDVVKKVNFEQIFMFIYSRRVGTLADKMSDQIPEEIKHKRFDRLKDLYEKSVEENNKKYVGTIQKILVEGYSKNNKNMLTRKNRYKQGSSIGRK